jgi:hypothetical protein
MDDTEEVDGRHKPLQLMTVQTQGASRMLTSTGKSAKCLRAPLLSQSALTFVKAVLCRSFELMTVLPHRAHDVYSELMQKPLDYYILAALKPITSILPRCEIPSTPEFPLDI